MKKVFKSLFVIVAAMITFAGCAKQEIDAPATSETKTVQFFAESIETKTAFGTPDGKTYPTLWTANDKAVKLSLNYASPKDADIIEVSDDFITASFTAEITDDESGAYVFYAMSPASAYNNFNANNKYLSANISTTQTPLANSVDEKAQVLYAVSEQFDEMPSSVSLNFKHFTAYGKLSFVNLNLNDATVTSVTITSSVDFAGRWNYMVESGAFQENSGSSEITLSTSNTENLWFACAPVDMNNQTLTFTVNTDKGPLSKTVTLTNKKFEAGKIATMKVDMAGIEFAESVVYELVTDPSDLTVGSEIIIVAADSDVALSTTQNNNNRGQAGVTKDGDTISDPGSTVQVITIEDGTKDGTVAFNVGNGYLYAASSSSNHLKTETTLSDNSSWTVSIADGVATIIAQGTNTRNTMQYNQTSSLFSCYGSASQKAVSIYKRQGSGTVLENYLNVPTKIDVDAKTTTAQIPVKSDLSWTATSSLGASLDKNSETGDAVVNVTFPENTSSDTKIYTVTFTADGIEKVVTITQAAVEPETPVFASLAELIATITPTTTATKVTVTLTDEEITGIYTTGSGYRNGVFLQVGEKEIEIYCYNVPTEWEVGGTVSGTLTECDWKLYNTTWELCPADWSELTYTAPAGGGTTEPDEPVVPGENITISVDFESDTYSEWTTTNMQLKQTGTITAKEGTYYGTTGGKESASIATKNTYASPKSITCYVSKQSSNTNASSIWKIEVSTDGNTWTEVKTQAAASMNKGTWVEFTADLSTYTNVYVRVSYAGTTAVRNIDALTFTYSE